MEQSTVKLYFKVSPDSDWQHETVEPDRVRVEIVAKHYIIMGAGVKLEQAFLDNLVLVYKDAEGVIEKTRKVVDFYTAEMETSYRYMQMKKIAALAALEPFLLQHDSIIK